MLTTFVESSRSGPRSFPETRNPPAARAGEPRRGPLDRVFRMLLGMLLGACATGPALALARIRAAFDGHAVDAGLEDRSERQPSRSASAPVRQAGRIAIHGRQTELSKARQGRRRCSS